MNIKSENDFSRRLLKSGCLLLVLVLGCIHSAFAEQKVNMFNGNSKLSDAYGICSHISRVGVDWIYRDKDLDCINQLGISYVRTDFVWNALKPSNKETPVYLSRLSLTMNSANAHKVKVLPIISGLNYANIMSNMIDWQNYLVTLLRTYHTQIPVWEFWNEMNLKGSWQETPSAQNYCNLLKIVYQKVKSVDANDKVALGGVAGFDKAYLQSLFAAGAGNYFDIMNIHLYTGTDVPETMLSIFQNLKQLMDQYHVQKPVWLTETGYNTADAQDDYSKFFNQVLPQALSKIGLKQTQVTVGLLYDDKYTDFDKWKSDEYFKQYASCKYISFKELQNLDPKKVQVLVPSAEETFPMECYSSIINYVKRGGTIVCLGGLPFYYNRNLMSSAVLPTPKISDIYSQLHIGLMPWWDKRCTQLKAPKVPSWQKTAEGFSFNYRMNLRHTDGIRYLTTDHLKGNDKFIPILEVGDNNYTGSVIGLYKLNSDLKGNVIVNTARSASSSVSETTQAERLPRAYLVAFSTGVDKVFWYNLRALENSTSNNEDNFGIIHKDFRVKPAYTAYKTLTTMCPDRSSRPDLQKRNNVYISSWTRPDGSKVSAVWSANIDHSVKLMITGAFKAYNYLGNPISLQKTNFVAKAGIVYIVGAKSVNIE